MALTIVMYPAVDRVVVMQLCGELDYATAPDLREAVSTAMLAEPRPSAIQVDLTEVTVLDSTGIGTLVVGQRICGEVGVRLTVRNPSPFITRLFTVTGINEVLTG